MAHKKNPPIAVRLTFVAEQKSPIIAMSCHAERTAETASLKLLGHLTDIQEKIKEAARSLRTFSDEQIVFTQPTHNPMLPSDRQSIHDTLEFQEIPKKEAEQFTNELLAKLVEQELFLSPPARGHVRTFRDAATTAIPGPG